MSEKQSIQNPRDSQEPSARPSKKRIADACNLEASMIAGLRNAASYAELAAAHAEIFDEAGFIHDAERFVMHAKLVSEQLRSYRKLLGS